MGTRGMDTYARLSGTLRFVERAARDRLLHYRDQAAHLRELAEVEPPGRLRGELVQLAKQYDLIADNLVRAR